MADDNIKVTAAMRILIILYAAAIVAIGAYPMRREVRDIRAYLRRQAAGVLGSSKTWANWAPDRPAKRGEVKDVSLSIGKPQYPKKDERLDDIRRSDREQLGNLINKLGK